MGGCEVVLAVNGEQQVLTICTSKTNCYIELQTKQQYNKFLQLVNDFHHQSHQNRSHFHHQSHMKNQCYFHYQSRQSRFHH